MTSLAKTSTFAIVHFTVAFSVAYALTGDIGISSALALLEPMVNTVAYYIHERVWQAAQDRGDATSTGTGHALKHC